MQRKHSTQDFTEQLIHDTINLRGPPSATLFRDLAQKYGVHSDDVQKRYYRFVTQNQFTKQEENQLIDEATAYFDRKEEPDWIKIAKDLRGKDKSVVQKKYYEVMKEFWTDELTKKLSQLVIQQKKEGKKKINWDEIGGQMDGRPPKVCQDQYNWWAMEELKRKQGTIRKENQKDEKKISEKLDENDKKQDENGE